MSIAHHIKEIGRGKEGARALTTAQAHDLMSQVLDRRVTDLERGAFCLAMRIKGETPDELTGFVQAAHERCMALPRPPAAGVVVLPSYNGARRLPNFTPLLARVLAAQGVGVLVHGLRQDPTRITSAAIFEAMGTPPARDADDVQAAWTAGRPAFVPTDILCPPLAELLQVRWTIGLRNSGHTVAKLLQPWPEPTMAPVFRVINHTHPEYALSLTAWLGATKAHALLMRGTEGEPVADCRRQPRLDVFIDGRRDESLSRAPQEGALLTVPELPPGIDAATTAMWIESVVRGERVLPEPLAQQVRTLIDALAATPVSGDCPARG